MWRTASCEPEELGPLAEPAPSPRPGAFRHSLRRAGTAALLLAVLAAVGLLLGAGAPGGAKRGEAAEVIVADEVTDVSDVCEWEVVWPTGVHVRSGRSIYSAAVEVKAEKERFRGKQDGGWVALAGKRGFMLIRNGEHVLIKRTAGAPSPAATAAPTTAAPTTAAPTTAAPTTAAPTTAAPTTAAPTTAAPTTAAPTTAAPTTTTAAPATTTPRTTSSSTTAAPSTVEDFKEVDGHLEWEVVADSKSVFVRMDTSPTALVLEVKKHGAVLVGSRQGNWLRLWHNRGFIHIVENGVVQVKERTVAYSQIPRGSCALADRFPIQDAAVCEAAAATLGLPKKLQVEDLAPFKDPGCFMRPGGSAVSFSMHAAGGLSGAAVNGWLLCSTTVAAVAPIAKLVPEDTTTPAPTTPATTTTPEIRPSLFCWVVAMVHKRAQQVNSEVTLMRNAHNRGAGIFACNQWRVFSDEEVPLGKPGGPNTTAIPGPPSQLGSIPNLGFEAKMLLNTGVFFRAWDKVLDDKVFASYDWTVKLDPDCVFFPDRLRIHLRQSKYNFWQPIYFNNCQRWNSMQGPVELFSRGAMQKLAAEIPQCKQQIDQTHIGEDIFMQKCTVQLGMQAMSDWKLLNDQYCMHKDNPCADTWTVGFHPYKSVDLWNSCYDQAAGR